MDLIGLVLGVVGLIISVFFAWWVYVIYAILMVIYYLFFADLGGGGSVNARPMPFDAPQVSASSVIPVLFGTMYIRNKNVVWYGDVRSVPWEKCA